VRRLRRILLNALTALPLILFVAVVVLWVRSYWQADIVQRLDQYYNARAVVSVRGGILFYSRDLNRLADDSGRWKWFARPPDQLFLRPTHWSVFGFSRSDVTFPRSSLSERPNLIRDKYVRVPYWAFGTLGGATGSILLRCSIRHRIDNKRQGAQHCRVCGYDLRATPERCPDCGSIAKA
jgi:hypothetical protein